MPFKIVKVKSGFKVKNENTKKVYSKKPLTKEKAGKQLKAILINYNKKKP